MSFIDTALETIRSSSEVRAALYAVFLTSLSGAVVFLLIKSPKGIFFWLKHQCITSLNYNSQSVGWSDYNQKQYIAFVLWLGKTKWFERFSRVATIDCMETWTKKGYKRHQTFGPGLGRHYFRLNGKFFWADITEKESQGTSVSKFNLTVSCFGRSHEPIRQLLNHFIVEEEETEETTIYTNGENDWVKVGTFGDKPLSSVVIEEGILESILEKIETFQKEKEWYTQAGINYKIAFLFYGVPGTGKTSLIRAIASHLKRDIYNYIPGYKLDELSGLLSRSKGGIVTIEDIDGYGIGGGDAIKTKPPAKKMEAKPVDTTKSEPKKEEIIIPFTKDDLPKLLNAIDGIAGLDDVILFITTNHPEKLNGAFLRDGRIDFRIEIPAMSNKTICTYANKMYGSEIDASLITANEVPGATVQTAFMTNRYDFNGFVKYVNNWVPEELKAVELGQVEIKK